MFKLRRFPYPFKCALSISSDIDNASSLESFIAVMDYFNSQNDTPFGEGLGLEVGNSFWFYNNSESEQLSYFDGLSENLSPLAPLIEEYWKSGHIDTLHSWGNFDAGRFNRSHAESALSVLRKHKVKIPIWINHGIGLNHQKVGNYRNMHGDDPDHPAYHMDLTTEAGCEYFWIGKTTHIIGQDADHTLSVYTKRMIQWLMKHTRYRNVIDPIYDDGNQLCASIRFRDGTQGWEFTRFINAWGRENILDVNELATQLSPRIINQLIKNRGFMILYTHFNEHVKMTGLPQLLIKHLDYLKRKTIDKTVFMTTTSRLLKYKEMRENLIFQTQIMNDEMEIHVSKEIETPVGIKLVKHEHLQGLTFYTDSPKKTKILFEQTPVKISVNSKDETGKQSVSIPWIKLNYPR